MPIELIKLSSRQLEELPRDRTVFFFPVGPVEDHGPHLPLGLDLEEADWLCHSAAAFLEKDSPGWTGVVMPRAPLGVQANTTRLAITVRPYVLRDWLVDSCQSLGRAGFCHFVCFSGHPGPRQLTAIEEAGKMVRRLGRRYQWINLIRGQRKPGARGARAMSLVSANSAVVTRADVARSPLWLDPIEHGGRRDTSVALVVAPDLVDPSYRSLPHVERKKSVWTRSLNQRLGRTAGYWGEPAEAEVASGSQELTEFLEQVFPKLRAVWGGANPNFLFRSWYSILPPNQSFFKAWVLLFLIFLFVAGWAFLMTSMLDLK